MGDLSDFREAAANPAGYAKKIKEQGKKIVGYFCSYTPEEIIYAAGVHPMRLFGGKNEISLADSHLQAYCCSLVRSGLEEGLSGRLDFLDGTVFPHTCDSIQRLSDIWRLNTNFGFFSDVVLPVKLNTDSAKEYMVDVLNKFRRELGEWTGREITDDTLATSLETYNKIRECLEKLYELRAGNPGLIHSADLYAVIKGSMIMDRDYLVGRLPEVVLDVKNGNLSWEPNNAKRLMMVGGICDHPDIYGILEESGGVVVWDDLCTGSRWFEGKTDPGDPVRAMAERYTGRPVCPAKHSSPIARGENAVNLAKKYNAEGAVFLLLKFCDPHSFDYPYMKEYLDKAGVPSLLYEVEDQLPSAGQLQTRFETFIHML